MLPAEKLTADEAFNELIGRCEAMYALMKQADRDEISDRALMFNLAGFVGEVLGFSLKQLEGQNP